MFKFVQKRFPRISRRPSNDLLEDRLASLEGQVAAYEQVISHLIATADEMVRRALSERLKAIVLERHPAQPVWVPAKQRQGFRDARCNVLMTFIEAAEQADLPPQSQ
jgi:uncharacterized coiled-coil protein SlyX